YAGDEAGQVEAAFHSATAAQDLAPAQVVVVRDGPVPPGLAAVLGRLAAGEGVTLVALATNVGLARALNAGLAASRFDVVARQDADDVSAPSRFRLTVPMVASGRFDLVGSAVREFSADADGSVTYGAVRRYPLTGPEIRRRAKWMNPLAHPAVVLRRSQVLAAGGYRDLFHLEDYDLWVRLFEAGARAANRPEPLVDYRVSAAGRRRRGGLRTLRAERALQRAMVGSGFINRAEWLRNLVLRGGLELAPPGALGWALRQVWRRPG
ncbi:MAG: glycosyltransferase, partial [Bifidobacteriaceae bacterium]|nr:glycosyltransferase [Bifidobacteriaceae bacterium]